MPRTSVLLLFPVQPVLKAFLEQLERWDFLERWVSKVNLDLKDLKERKDCAVRPALLDRPASLVYQELAE